MKEFILYIVSIIVGIALLSVLLRGGNLALNSYFSPKEEAVRREVFENTKSFTQGTIQELSSMYIEYNNPKTTDSQKKAIKAVVLHQTSDFDTNKLPAHLGVWVNQLRMEM